MGKKRRLNSAKAKFRAKHSNHPRMKLLTKDDVEEISNDPAEEPEITAIPIKVAPPPPKVKKVAAPKKKKPPTRRKRTTKKKTTSASA